MQLSKATIDELRIILEEEFNLFLPEEDLNKLGNSLIGYFDLLLKKSKFGNHPVSLIDKAKAKEEN